jgi:hypothetical protein
VSFLCTLSYCSSINTCHLTAPVQLLVSPVFLWLRSTSMISKAKLITLVSTPIKPDVLLYVVCICSLSFELLNFMQSTIGVYILYLLVSLSFVSLLLFSVFNCQHQPFVVIHFHFSLLLFPFSAKADFLTRTTS